MYYYKFRVVCDTVDDFVRDIEILATDNFESFHNILYSSIGLSGNELASFSICDAKWNKKQEITLIDMFDDQEVETPEYDENDDFSTQSNIPKFVMKDVLLKDFITDPHQQMIYEYNFLNPQFFYIELLKTLEVNPKITYPRCTNSVKELPKQAQALNITEDDTEFVTEEGYSEEDLDAFNDEFNDDISEFDQFDDSREY
ncbi:MAG: hypothetical protein CVU04_02240 [Bacteroidetes bacterium HGW-Bacteroidetes-20]|nr:MAG: hypothetical protein CVU04_02240 [Bacteroidetes bacterium HGW-Bacteroidetes-20]